MLGCIHMVKQIIECFSYSSTTLIHNIFKNELRFNLTSGIMFNDDISDHLQCFHSVSIK